MRRHRALARWIPVGVLAASLVLWGLATWGFRQAVEGKDRARFRGLVESMEDRVASRVEIYIALLRATRGFLLAAPGPVDPEAFHRYVLLMRLQQRYPGIQGIGYSVRIPRGERRAVEARIGQELGHPFRVWPDTPRDELHAIAYLEPLDRRNAAAIGFDMFSEPVRRRAMERARDTAQAAASGVVTLVQEIDPAKQAGFLIYVPVYDGAAPASVADRRRDLRGFVYAPFRAGDLLAGIFGSESEPGITFDVYDGAATKSEALMARAGGDEPAGGTARFRTERPLFVAGRLWTLVFRTTPAFDALSSRRFVPLFALVGVLASVGLFFVSRAQVRAVRLRDEFLSVAGHELRTPLSTLKLLVQSLDRQAHAGAFGPAAPRLLERLGKAERQVDRLDRLVGELLDVSRITSGRLTLHPEEVDLDVLVHDVADRLAEPLQRSGSPLSIRSEPRVVGRWDRARLDQVLTNLVTNAIKYGGGRPIDVTLERAAGEARVTVRDRGIGIPRADRGRIFGRFERAVSERHYGGLGLGLWIVRQIVQAHGGRITVESAPGKGSAFTVELPIEPAT